MKNLSFKKVIFLVIGAIIVGSIIGYIRSVQLLALPDPASPNVLVISFCSLKKDFLGLYSKDAEAWTPNISQLFRKSYVFKNAFTKYPWTNLANYAEVDIPQSYFTERNYRLLEDHGEPFYMRIPPGWEQPSKIGIQTHQLPLYYQKDFETLKNRITKPSPFPFFLIAHIKYMHYPYIDTLNPNPNWDFFLTEKEKARVKNLLENSDQYPNKVSFQMVLSANPEILIKHPQIRLPKPVNELFNGFGFIADPKYLNPWTEEADYNLDFDLLRKIYKAKLRYMDQNLRELFDLFGDNRLQRNTVFIFTGDHGEAFMEHNLLTHAINIYDEMITFPLMIRFPNSTLKGPTIWNEQFYMSSLNDLIMGIMKNQITEENFLPSVAKLQPKNEYIMLRNCNNTIRGVRWNNRWKLIINNETSETVLFDLVKDPSEKKNVYELYPDIAAKLEMYIMEHSAELKKNLETRSLCEV